jgi:malic enzyme
MWWFSLEGRMLKSLIEIEGMAIAGLIDEVTLEDCVEPPGWKKIVVVDRKGVMYETKCLEPQVAKRNYMVLSAYTVRWSSLIVYGEKETNLSPL